MVTARARSRFEGALRVAAAAAAIAVLAAAALPAQAAYVAEPKDALQSAAAALRERLAATGEEGSFIAAGEVQQAPDAGAVIPTIALPAPEPETYALMLAGLGVVGWAARRRRSA